MKRSTVIFACILFSHLLTSAQAEESFVGKWVSLSPSNGGIRIVTIAEKDKGLSIRVHGHGHSTDYDWGTTQLLLVADSATSKRHRFAFAKWQTDDAEIYLTLRFDGVASVYLVKDAATEVPQIRVESMVIFKNDKKRSHYRKVALLYRER